MHSSREPCTRKNTLSIEICGKRSSVAWDQERPKELWVGHRDAGNQILLKAPSLLKPAARTCAVKYAVRFEPLCANTGFFDTSVERFHAGLVIG